MCLDRAVIYPFWDKWLPFFVSGGLMGFLFDMRGLRGDPYFERIIEKARKGEQVGGEYIFRENIGENVKTSNGKTVVRRYRYYYISDMLKDSAEKLLKNIGSFFFKGKPEEVERIEKSYETENIQKDYGADKKTWYEHVLEYFSHRSLWDRRFSDKKTAEKWKKPVKTVVAEKIDAKGMETPADKAPTIMSEAEKKPETKKWKANPSLMRKVWSLYTGKQAAKEEKQQATAEKVIAEKVDKEIQTENKNETDAKKDFKDLADIIKNKASLNLKNDNIGEIKLTYAVNKSDLKHIIERRYAELKNKYHIEDENERRKLLTSFVYSLLQTVKHGSAETQKDGRSYILRSNGISAVARKNSEGKVVVTGFVDNSNEEEGAETIAAVNAGYGYTPEFLELYAQVGAALSSNNNTANDKIVNDSTSMKSDSLSRCKALYNEAYRKALQDLRSGKAVQIGDDAAVTLDELAEDKQSASATLDFYTRHFSDWNNLDTVNATLEMYAEEPDGNADKDIARMAREKAVQDSLRAYLGLNVNLPEESEAEKHANRSEAMIGNQNAKKDFKNLSEAIKNKSSFEVENPSLGNVSIDFSVNSGKNGLVHIIKRRFEELYKNGKGETDISSIGKRITAILYSVLNNVKTGVPKAGANGNTWNLNQNGITAIVKQDKGKFLLTGFADNASEKEAAETIAAVNAGYGYTPEFLDLYAQVGAVIASVNNDTSGTKNVNGKNKALLQSIGTQYAKEATAPYIADNESRLEAGQPEQNPNQPMDDNITQSEIVNEKNKMSSQSIGNQYAKETTTPYTANNAANDKNVNENSENNGIIGNGGKNGKDNTGAEQAGLSERSADLRGGRSEEPGNQNVAGAERGDNGDKAVLGTDQSGDGLGNADGSVNVGRGRITKGQAREIRRQCREILEKPDSAITADDKAVLSQYVGAGGTGEDDASNSGTLYEFYTPRNVISKVWQIVDKYNPEQGKSVIEPSSGIGRFAEGRKEKFTLFELEEESARIAHILHPDADVVQGAFQENFMRSKGGRFTKKFTPYDVAVGNPPYGAYTGKYKGLGEGKNFKRYESYFMARSLDTLKDGGIMAMVVPSGFMDGKSTYGKDLERIAEKGELLEAWRLPNGTFDSTDVGTDIVVFRKGKGGSVEQIKSYFDKHPEHIAGEISTRTNRFGKEESYVKPKDGQTFESAVDSIDAGTADKEQQTREISQSVDAKESEAEKHANRSNAMRGNQNAKKLFSELSDTEKAQKAEQIRNNVVSSVKADSVPYNGDGKFAKAAKEWVKNNPQGNAHSVIGEIMITPNSADSDLRHGDKQDHYMKLQTLPAVKEVLENGTYLGYERDFEGKNISNHYFAGKIKYGNEEKIVFCRVRETDGLSGRFYVHEVFTEDELKKEASKRTSNPGSLRLTGKPHEEASQVPEIDIGLPQLTGKPHKEDSNAVADVDPSLLTGTPLYQYILQDVLNVNEKRTLDLSGGLEDTGKTGTAKNGNTYRIYIPTADFWNIYKESKGDLKENGYQLVKTKDGWRVFDYNVSGSKSAETGKTDAEKKASRSRAMQGNKNAEGEHEVSMNPNAHKMSVEEFNRKYGKNFDAKDMPVWKATDRAGNIDMTRLSDSERDYVEHSGHYVKDGGMYVNTVNYASGNIREKLGALSKDDPQYDFKKSLLEAVCPEEKKIGQFTLSPITDWAREYRTQDGRSLIDGFFEWAYNGHGYYSASDSPIAREEIPPDLTFSDIKDFIDKTPYKMSRSEARDFDDKKQAAKARERRKQLRRETAIKLFNRYLQEGLPVDDQKDLTEAWNLKANSFVNPDFTKIPVFVDGMSTHKGSKEFTLMEQQMKGISMLTNKGTGLLAYDVGVGKTACGVVATVNQIQTGRAKRPLICVPKAVYSNWIDNIHELFPDIKVNGLGNLSNAYWKDGMTVEPGTISVCTYEGLENIGFNDEEEAELKEDVEFASYTDNGDKKETARQKASKDEKTNEKVGEMLRTRNEGVQFSDLGFDHITVDEVHNFRNLFKMPRHINKKNDNDDNENSKVESNEFDGLGSGGEPSNRAKKLFAITQLIQRHNGGRNTFLLSATPFQNSPTEIYSILSYMARDELKKRGFYSLEQFVSNFCKVQREYVVKANRVTEAPVVKGFEDLSELQNLLTSYMDKVDGEEAGVVRPYKRMHAPELELSKQQKAIMANISSYIEEQETKSKEDRDDGYMFRAMNAMKNCALSPALVTDSEFNPFDSSKMGFVESSPKLKFVCDSIIEQYKKNSHNGQIMYMPLGVEQFPKVKEYLVKHGMPKEAVATISGGATTDKAMDARDAIFKDFNNADGKCKVIIGSSTIKEGCNLQGNTTTIYCTQLDWNPTDVQQLWGRGWRQGNKQGIVHCVTPLMHDSLDPMIYQKHDEKSARTNDIYSFKGDKMNSQDVNPEELKFALIKDPGKRADLQVMEYSEKNKSDEKMYGQMIDVLYKQIGIAFETDESIEQKANEKALYGDSVEKLERYNAELKAEISNAKKAIATLTKKYKGKEDEWERDFPQILKEIKELKIEVRDWRISDLESCLAELKNTKDYNESSVARINSQIRQYASEKRKLEKTREAQRKYLESKGIMSADDGERKIQDYVRLMDTARDNVAKAKDMRAEFYAKAVADNKANEKNLLSVDELVKDNVDSIMNDLHPMDEEWKAKIKAENDKRFGRVSKSLPMFFFMNGRFYINKSARAGI